jgi:hypothetical protein
MGSTISLRALLVLSLAVALSSFSMAKAFAVPLIAAPIQLAWDASPDPAVAGYALYCRSADSSVAIRLDAGAAQAITIPNLLVGSNYIFWVVAYDGDGVESAPSDPIAYNPPALSHLRLSQQTDGTVTVEFRAAAGSLCRVECTSTLTSPQWEAVGDAIADANGNVVVNDPPSGRPVMRFYRGTLLIPCARETRVGTEDF